MIEQMMVDYEVDYYEHSAKIVKKILNQSRKNILDEEYEELGNMLSKLNDKSRLDLVLYVVKMIEKANKDITKFSQINSIVNTDRSYLANYEKWEKLIKFISWFVPKDKKTTDKELLDTLS